MQPEAGRDNYYLEDTIVIDWQTPDVMKRASELTRDLEGDVAKARALFTWVRDEIENTADAGGDALPCRASEVLRAGTGIGFSKSHLLAALLRATGLPAGFAYQVLNRPDERGRTLLYGFNGVHLASLDRWVALDARGNRDGLHAEFDPDTPSLAVHADPSAGEFVYDTVFARPAKAIVDLLDGLSTLDQLAPHVPEELEDVPRPG